MSTTEQPPDGTIEMNGLTAEFRFIRSHDKTVRVMIATGEAWVPHENLTWYNSEFKKRCLKEKP